MILVVTLINIFFYQECAPGYRRDRQGGRWKGTCVRDVVEECPAGYYGDPSRGISCRQCPCPLTVPSNQ